MASDIDAIVKAIQEGFKADAAQRAAADAPAQARSAETVSCAIVTRRPTPSSRRSNRSRLTRIDQRGSPFSGAPTPVYHIKFCG